MKRNIPLTVDVEPVYDGPVLFQYPVNAVYLLSFQAVLAVVEHAVVEHGLAFAAAESLICPARHLPAAIRAYSRLLIHTARVFCRTKLGNRFRTA